MKQLRSVIAVYPSHINRVKESKAELETLPGVKDCDRRITAIVIELRQLERDRAATGERNGTEA